MRKPWTDAEFRDILKTMGRHATLSDAIQEHNRKHRTGRTINSVRWKLTESGHPGYAKYLQPAPSPASHASAASHPRLEKLIGYLKGGDCRTFQDVCDFLDLSPSKTRTLLESAKEEGYRIRSFRDTPDARRQELVAIPDLRPAYADNLPEYVSRPDGTYVFGATGDNHLCSQYERLDVLNRLYDEFAASGVDRVYNCGNWIDGEANFNRHELHIHGMENQLNYLADKYPSRKGIKTYAISGDDHEGWYAQKTINIGHRAEQTMRDKGRSDWEDLGYLEAHVKLVHAKTGKFSIMSVCHPGGGTAYALSYTVQKLIESLEGGEKPAVALYGHYHKLWCGDIRNVWCLQVGCTQDQTTFLRKKRIRAHVGGAIVTLRQDPKTGAIVRFQPDMLRYFNRGYYNDRWSRSGKVVLPDRDIL